MPEDQGELEAAELLFLRYFFARSYSSLFRPLYAAEVGQEIGVTRQDALIIADHLRERRLLEQICTSDPGNPLMQINQRGVDVANQAAAADAGTKLEAEDWLHP